MTRAFDDLMSAEYERDTGDLMKIYQYTCDGWGDEF